jgi:Contractile injection system tube protein
MATLKVTALEGRHEGEVLESQFNPKEVVLEGAVLWRRQVHKGPADLEFEQVEPARMSFELVFDEAESLSSVQPQIDKLHRFSSVDAILHRPPKVEVSWGAGAGAMPTFGAVIESVAIRYELFAENGLPLRACVDLKLKQAAHLGVRAS